MAKRPTGTIPKQPTRKQLSRRAKEAAQQRLLFFSMGALAIVVVGLLSFGLYQEYVAKPTRALARVNGVPIRANDYEKMLAYRKANLNISIEQLRAQLQRLDPNDKNQEFLVQYYQQQIEYLESQLDQAPQQALEGMIDDELIRQEAARVGIAISDEQVQLEIEKQFGYDRNPAPLPTPITATTPITLTPEPTSTPMTEEEFRRRYNEVVQSWKEAVGFGEQDFRELFRMSLLRDEFERYLGNQVPRTEPQVHARHILLKTREEAEAALVRLKAGEDFATLAQELSADESNREQGGDLGWFPRGVMATEFEEVAFNTPVGETSDVFTTTFGFHILKVEERDENRELDEMTWEERKQGVLENWLTERRYSEAVERLETIGQ